MRGEIWAGKYLVPHQTWPCKYIRRAKLAVVWHLQSQHCRNSTGEAGAVISGELCLFKKGLTLLELSETGTCFLDSQPLPSQSPVLFPKGHPSWPEHVLTLQKYSKGCNGWITNSVFQGLSTHAYILCLHRAARVFEAL